MHVNRKTAVIGSVAIILSSVLLLSLAWGLQHAALANPPVLGRTAPLLAIKPLSGDVVRVRELQGSPVVLNFWASWCGPCIEEARVLGQAFREGQGNVSYVGADNRDTDSAYQSFEKTHPHPYPAGPIVLGSYQSYGVAGLPATFFIDKQGTVLASFVGPLDRRTLNHYIELITR